MDFKIFKSKNKINNVDLKNKLNEYNFYEQEQSDVSLFHINPIQENIYHMVFVINEELVTTSKYVKNINKMPLNIYVNTFLYLDNSSIYIENLYNEYFQLILKEIKNIENIEFEAFKFTNDELIDIIKNKSDKVLQCDFEVDDSIVSYENFEQIQENIINKEIIDYVNLTPNIEEYKKVLVSINKNGKVNIKATIPKVLIKLIEYYFKDL